MIVKSDKQLNMMEEAGRVVAYVRDSLAGMLAPGITTRQLDDEAGRLFKDAGAISAPKCEYRFPGNICICVNDEAAHGIPSDRALKQGDIVNLDVSAHVGGYFSDTGATYSVGKADSEKERLLSCGANMLKKGLSAVKTGGRISSIGREMELIANEYGFSAIRALSGHGIGQRLHDQPRHIYAYYNRRDLRVMKRGMALAVESFVSTGNGDVRIQPDRWTLKTVDSGFAAQFEHTVIVTDGEPMIITL